MERTPGRRGRPVRTAVFESLDAGRVIKLGRWHYVKIHSPHDLESVLGKSLNS